MPEWLSGTFKALMDDISSGIIICGEDLKILYINKFYAHLLGTTPERAVGGDIRDFFPDSRVPYVLRSGNPELRQPCHHRKEIIGHDTDIMLLVNRLPVKQDGRTVAVVIETIFKDTLQVKDFMLQNNLLRQEVRHYRRRLDSALSPTYTLGAILGGSRPIAEARSSLKRFADADGSLLILGKTGAGKELFAHAAHAESRRHSQPFVCVNCAAIPGELLESELFGYESGAFTGARQGGKAGKVEMANGGTLFLDEIGDLLPSAQAKLLRVLETKTVERLGGTKSIRVDFRLISATHADLEQMIARREFREDLYYRISSMVLTVPSLAERREDILPLAHHFLATGRHPQARISTPAAALLKRYDWPGNVRELKNAIEQAVSLADGAEIGLEHLSARIQSSGKRESLPAHPPGQPLAARMAEFESRVITEALEAAGGKRIEAARSLGISRSTFYEKAKTLGLI